MTLAEENYMYAPPLPTKTICIFSPKSPKSKNGHILGLGGPILKILSDLEARYAIWT